MRNPRFVIRLMSVALGAALIGGMVIAAPPGPIDGQNIPSNFGAGALLATQTNKTGFGDQTVTTGALTDGSELDELFLAKSGTDLKLAISGNLREPNHVLIFIGGTGEDGLGQQELRAQGVDGPPYTVQNVSQEMFYNTNGTPGNTADDTCDVTSNGTMLPCTADFAIGIDTFGGNVSVSEYTLFISTNGSFDCGAGTLSPTYASRVFATQSTLNTAPPATNDQALGYAQIGFQNNNTAGVSSSDCTTATTAGTGLEMTIPLGRLGLTGTETVNLFVAMVSDGGFFGNQVFPTQVASCGTACSSPGFRPVLAGSCMSVNLGTLAAFGAGDNLSDGNINPADYTAAARRTQTCPTDFGDQAFDPNGVTITGGSELNEMYVTNDSNFLYVGLSGNLERNNNGLLLYIESGQTGGQGGSTPIAFTGGGRVAGMNGNFLPFDQDNANVDFDYAVEVNNNVPTGPASGIKSFVDFNNLLTNTRISFGSNNVNSNGAAFSPAAGNVNGFVLAYNFLNEAGVLGDRAGFGCGNGGACDARTNAQVAADAASGVFGFELAIPLADIGLSSASLPATIELWAFVTNNNGFYGSNQALPSLRDPTNTVPGNSVENAGTSPTSPNNLDYSNDGSVGNCSVNPPGDPHCQYAYFARSARYVAVGVPAATVTSALSRRTNPHVSTGGFCDTATHPTIGVERHSGGVRELRITFNTAPATPSSSEVMSNLSQATCAAPAFAPYSGPTAVTPSVAGNTLVLSFSPGLETGKKYRLTIPPSVTSIAGQGIQVRSLAGDADGNGLVNSTDRSVVVGVWTGTGFTCNTDIDSSGATNSTDRSLVVGAWTGGSGANCAP